MRLQVIFNCCLLIVYMALLAGCSIKSYHSAWPKDTLVTSSSQTAGLLASARKKFDTAGSEEDLLDSMESFKNVLEIDPGNREALTSLCNQYILLGTAYTSERSLKYQYYQKAMQNCELAMYTNPQFKHQVDKGKKPWEAAETLKAEDAPAMLFWVTALQYEFKEAMRLPSKVVNVRWMQHALVFLDRIKEVAPDYGNGAVELAYTVCYCVLPRLYGGDEQKCYGYMNEAVEKSEGHLLARWGRGRFFYQVTGDKESARKDLQWVIEQDPSEYRDVYPWKVHFQEDAALQFLKLSE
jgi:tetratricopeptide (TPR) repeat protein